MKFKKARKVIRKAFKKNSSLKKAYVSNVSVHLYSTFIDPKSLSMTPKVTMTVKETRDKLAEEIIDLIFGE